MDTVGRGDEMGLDAPMVVKALRERFLHGLSWSGGCRVFGVYAVSEDGVDLASHVALEASDDLGLRHALCSAALDVGAGGRVEAHADEHDPVEGCVGLTVPASVEAMADGLA
jgi:hypothetical protein